MSSVLVTRPVGAAADGLCAAVEAAGYRAYHQPLIELFELPQLPPSQRQLIMDLDQFQHVIFISTNAVHFGMARMNDLWPQLPLGINWYAVGDATARQLQQFDIQAITPGSNMTSEGLLALPYLRNVQGQRVLLVKGEGGRDALLTTLLQRGAIVEKLICYRRGPVELPAGALATQIIQQDIEAIMLSSGEGLTNFLRLLSPLETTKFKHIGLIVPSERVAALGRDAGFEEVVIAENASDMAMLRALQQWRPALENKK